MADNIKLWGEKMEMVTIKQLAEKKHVSYEAVRRMVKKYEKDLKDHIFTGTDGSRLLDDVAVEFLTDRRRQNVVVARAEDTTDELGALRDQLKAAQAEIVALQAARIADQQQIITLQQESTQARLEDKTARAAAETRAEELHKQLEQARMEIDSFVPSLFGFYRKKRQ